MRVLDVLQHLRDGGELRQQLLEELLPAPRDHLDRHGQALLLVEVDDDVGGRPPAPGVEEVLGELAAPLVQRPLPGHVVQRHRVGDGAVAVEQVRRELTGGQRQTHPSRVQRVGRDRRVRSVGGDGRQPAQQVRPARGTGGSAPLIMAFCAPGVVAVGGARRLCAQVEASVRRRLRSARRRTCWYAPVRPIARRTSTHGLPHLAPGPFRALDDQLVDQSPVGLDRGPALPDRVQEPRRARRPASP